VLQNVEEVAKAGAREIVLTGINLGDFGKGMHGGKKKEESFFELMKALEEHAPIERIRISSIEPNLLENEMIEFVKNSNKFMPHFHIPLQSGSNKILGQMRRRYKRELYADKVAMIKSCMPHACIGVDVIVGFPGETEEDFLETVHFLNDIDISYLHVFTYSERANTDATDMGNTVPMHTRHERNKVLRQLSHAKMMEFTRQHAGTKRNVLFEGKDKNGSMEGYSDNYIRVSAMYDPKMENSIVEWTI
jgi:threonylcarbamoyladenosine tRNA methylthiotransferase MtaB